MAPVFEAHTAIAVERRSHRRRVAMWVGLERTVLACGDDPVTIRGIRAANTPLAVLDSLDLRRDGEGRCGSWWQVRITTNDIHHRIEGYDRSPGPTWLVVDEPGVTHVRRASIRHVAAAICTALETHMGPLPPPSLA